MQRPLFASRWRRWLSRPAGPQWLGIGLLAILVVAGTGADGAGWDGDALVRQAREALARVYSRVAAMPPADRVAWGGLLAAAGLALGVLVERSARLWPRRIIPGEFAARFGDRLQNGKLDRGKALDYCELNPSPAARVALAAVRRWGRPTADLERAVSLALRVETDRLRRQIGTLRRVAALAPLIGLLGTLAAAARVLATLGTNGGVAWGPSLAPALAPLTAGVALAALALVAYDGLTGRAETLAGRLERVGAETVDAIALSLPPDPRPSSGPVRTPHQIRLEMPANGGSTPSGSRAESRRPEPADDDD